MEQILSSSCLGFNTESNKYDTNMKLCKFQNLCGSIQRTLLEKVQKEVGKVKVKLSLCLTKHHAMKTC
jgi:hypothetical protein